MPAFEKSEASYFKFDVVLLRPHLDTRLLIDKPSLHVGCFTVKSQQSATDWAEICSPMAAMQEPEFGQAPTASCWDIRLSQGPDRTVRTARRYFRGVDYDGD